MFGILFIFLLLTKHMLADYPMQTEYHLHNKGKYGHLGGISHALIHGIGTFVAIFIISRYIPVTIATMLVIPLIDVIIHYHIDWVKVNFTNYLNLTIKDKPFWVLMGLDQYLHHMTYVMFAIYLLS